MQEDLNKPIFAFDVNIGRNFLNDDEFEEFKRMLNNRNNLYEFKKEVGNDRFYGKVNLTDRRNLIGDLRPIFDALYKRLPDLCYQNRLNFKCFVGKELLKFLGMLKNGAVVVEGIEGVGKTAFLELILLLEKLNGKKPIRFHQDYPYLSGYLPAKGKIRSFEFSLNSIIGDIVRNLFVGKEDILLKDRREIHLSRKQTSSR